MKLFHRCSAAILTLAIGATGRPAPRPDPERDLLRLQNGSLVECIRFRSAWLKEHPNEDAIIVPEETTREGQIHVTAICAYTERGAVLVHRADYGTTAMPGARSDLLNQGQPAFLAAYHRLVSESPVPTADDSTKIGDDDAQIARAYAALDDPAVMGPFPVAIAKLPSGISGPEGTAPSKNADWLIFDWNGGHYRYRPEAGVIRQPVPIDPLTRRPYLCVALGDLVESIIFCAEYRRTHPEEKAILLFVPHHANRGENTGGTAAAAFTKKGSLYFHSVFFGDIALSENGRVFTPQDLADPLRLHRAYESYLWSRFVSACRAKDLAVPDRWTIHRGGREFAELLGTHAPQELAGDNPELQIRRAFQRAQALGLSSEVGSQAPPEAPATPEPCLVLCWNVSEYVYAPARGGHYGVETDATVLPNRLIDGILFAHRYRREHPGQPALAIPYRESGGGKWKAVTVYARNDQVWLHNPETGETPFPAYAPGDLENPEKFKSIRIEGNRLIKAEAIRGLEAKSAKLNALPLKRVADTRALEPAAVSVQLAAAGIPCRLLATTRERDVAGNLRDYPSPSLTFTWWGVTYTYGPEHFCTASDGIVCLP
jgi:hypothetical protein